MSTKETMVMEFKSPIDPIVQTMAIEPKKPPIDEKDQKMVSLSAEARKWLDDLYQEDELSNSINANLPDSKKQTLIISQSSLIDIACRLAFQVPDAGIEFDSTTQWTVEKGFANIHCAHLAARYIRMYWKDVAKAHGLKMVIYTYAGEQNIYYVKVTLSVATKQA